MDYEKAYKDAIVGIREVYNQVDAATKAALEARFPELAESEDERIRKDMIAFLKSEKAFQTIDLPISERWIAWLEKQKEVPKSADSIPSDCVSDAKCGDRWQKVGDSLPDNPREVLCKDAAGNFFIGRYYVGEGWEISNYDDEDKPHDLNPPVVKWIDFPSEKQQEQKPADLSADWSEEDEALIENVCTALKGYALHKRKVDLYEHAHRLEEMSEKLKSLRPQPHWKPIGEQMEAVLTAQSVGSYGHRKALAELYNDLKKLCE